jgi:hypothetical protein
LDGRQRNRNLARLQGFAGLSQAEVSTAVPDTDNAVPWRGVRAGAEQHRSAQTFGSGLAHGYQSDLQIRDA